MNSETERAADKAAKTIASLEDQRELLLGRQNKLNAERQRIAYATHAEGDAKARSRLDKINLEFATFASELQSIDEAIREANARLNAARQTEAMAADRANAEQLLDKLKQFKEQGEILDDCFADFRSAAIEQKKLLDDIHALGQAAPTAQQYRVYCEIALKTAVQSTPFWSQDFPAMAPSQRKSFRDVCNAWVEPIMHRLNALLGDQKDKAA
jgi:chromosome segregation ATPase